MSVIEWYELIVCTLLLMDKLYGYGRKIHGQRFIDPKLAHQTFLLNQAKWFDERATKLAAFRWQLSNMENPDKFKVSYLASKLDRKDQDYAMKHESEPETLLKWAEEKGKECRDNAGEASRMADEVGYKVIFN